MMNPHARLAGVVVAALGTIVAMTGAAFGASQRNETSQKPSAKGVVIRGCLSGTKLTHVEPQNVDPAVEQKVPDVLGLTSIRVIRSQVKALNGHQVEVTGALRGIPGVETGLLVSDSDNVKVLLGGGGPDLVVSSGNGRPAIHAQMIKDLAETCGNQPK